MNEVSNGLRSQLHRGRLCGEHGPRPRPMSLIKTRPFIAFILATAVCARLSAQPAPPGSGKLEEMRNRELATRLLQPNVITAAPAALSVAITTRAESRAFYNAIFSASEGV